MHTVDLNQVSAEEAVAALQKYASGGMLGNVAMGGGIGAGIGAGGGLLAEYLSGRKRKNYMNALLGGGAMGGVLGAGAGAVYNGMSSGSKDPAAQSVEEQRMAAVADLRQKRMAMATAGNNAGVDIINKQLNGYGDTSTSPPVDQTPAMVDKATELGWQGLEGAAKGLENTQTLLDRGAKGAVIGAAAGGGLGGLSSSVIPRPRNYAGDNAAFTTELQHQANTTSAAAQAEYEKRMADFKADPKNDMKPVPDQKLELARLEAEYRKNNPGAGTTSAKGKTTPKLHPDVAGPWSVQVGDEIAAATSHNNAMAAKQKLYADQLAAAQTAAKNFPSVQGTAAAAAQDGRWWRRSDLPGAVDTPVSHPDIRAALDPSQVAAMDPVQRAAQHTKARVPLAPGATGGRIRGGIKGGAIAGGLTGMAAPWVARSLTSAFAPTKPTP